MLDSFFMQPVCLPAQSLRFCFSRRFSMCRALAKHSGSKLCIFLVLQIRKKYGLRHHGTLCLRGTKGMKQTGPHEIANLQDCGNLFSGKGASGGSAAASFTSAHFVAVTF